MKIETNLLFLFVYHIEYVCIETTNKSIFHFAHFFLLKKNTEKKILNLWIPCSFLKFLESVYFRISSTCCIEINSDDS